jgi:hypothetical protein
MSHKPIFEFWRRQADETDPTGWGPLPDDISWKEKNWLWEKHHSNVPDEWEEVAVEGGRPEWRLKDEQHRMWWDQLTEKQSARQGMENWHATRLPKRDYHDRKWEIEHDGIGRVRLTPQITGSLISLRVEFPPGFKHLTNLHGQTLKAEQASGYHISLAYTSGVDKNPELRNLLNTFLRRYFDMDGVGDIGKVSGKFFNFPNVRVSRGSTYELSGDDDFANDLRTLVLAGTNKEEPHISLD